MPVGARRCARCAEDAPSYAHLRAAFRFTGALRRALLEAKFRGVTRLIEPLAEAAARAVPLHWRIDAVVAVPLHRSRERRRGFNQAQIAAQLNAEGVCAPAGGEWSQQQVSRVLRVAASTRKLGRRSTEFQGRHQTVKQTATPEHRRA